MVDSKKVVEILLAIADKIEQQKDYLTELDQPIGDSDHGINLARGFGEVEKKLDALADKIVYTGMIDQYYDYSLGVLQYRSVRFETEELEMENYQGNAVVNYTERQVPYTRIIEHKHFEFGTQPTTIISREYSSEWTKGDEPYYPVNDERNNALYEQYREKADKEERLIFGGRLGGYKYYDMDKVIAAALELCRRELPPR